MSEEERVSQKGMQPARWYLSSNKLRGIVLDVEVYPEASVSHQHPIDDSHYFRLLIIVHGESLNDCGKHSTSYLKAQTDAATGSIAENGNMP